MTEKLNNTLTKLTTLFTFFLLVALKPGYSQSPVADFSASKTTGCAPLVVQFTDLSSGSPFSWNWDFGNGQLSTARNPIVNFSQPGVYTVRLVVRNANGIDEEIKTDLITVSPAPAVSFIANMTTACAPAQISFTDQTTLPPGAGTITNWLWSFGDGNTSTQQNPTHTYTSTGFYTVSLQVTSSTGCQSFNSIGRYIRIVSGINADFNFSQPGTCQPPFLVNFLDQSAGPGVLSYSWNFGNGSPVSTQQNPSSSYPAAGTYPVQLTVQSDLGCNGTITKNIIINGKTTNFIVPASICIGQTVTFQNSSSPAPASAFWDFGDGTTSSQTNPTKTFLAGGSYQVKLINNYGNCSDSITQTVNIVSQPPVDFRANDSTACRAPFTVQFTDASPAASTWLWSFGDGTTSNQQNPSHTYTSPGFFDVTLSITLPGGCSNTITKSQFIQIRAISVEIANTPAGGCIPFTFTPVASIRSVDSIVSYQWNLGEPGAVYNTPTPSHTYNTAGNYNISLTVTSQTGCSETISITNGVRTGTRPTVDFSFVPNNVCASTPVQFTDLSVTSPGAFVEWFWQFGDSLNSNLQNPLHVYEDTGTLTVRLAVSNNGCLDSTEKLIQILPPVAKFGYTVNCSNRLQVTFTDSSLTNAAYGPVSYEWRMGDPANTVFTGLPPPTFTYPALGTYTATLIVTNGACSYQKQETVILSNEAPAFSINKNPVCKGEIFSLNATVSNPAQIADYSWTIGTTSFPDTSQSINHSLFAYGLYDVTLTIEDVNGCMNTVTVPNYITVSGPVADFSPNSPGACVDGTVSFTDQSMPVNSPIVQWTWNFGDGVQQTYSAPPFSHTYTQTGSYSVGLIIKDNGNCADTITIPNAVLITRPIAAFRADTVYCPLAPLQFTDTSSGTGLTYTWNFGDGGVATAQNPTHTYAPGNNSYTVKLKIRDLVGCEDSVSKTGYINIRSPRAAFDILDSSGICLPLLTTFTFQGSDYQSFYWDFGDGGSSQIQSPTHFYNSYGTYTPTLYLTGPGGCMDSARALVNAYDPSANTQVNLAPSTACNSISTNFLIDPPPGFRFKFIYGDGSIDSSQQTNLTHTYSSPGVYYPYVLLSDRFGCEAAVATSTPVTVFGAIPLFDKSRKEFCDNGEVFFVNYTLNNDPIISTVWDFGDGSTSTQSDPSHIFSNPGTYLVRLSVVTQNQCASSYTDTIRVYKTPELSIGGRDTICVNSPEQFNGIITQPDSTIKWQWTLGNGTSSQVQNPLVTFTSTGDLTMQLIATNKLGCADTATQNIHVSPPPAAIAVATPLTIISGGAAQLLMNYTGNISNYTWSPSTHLTCTDCPTPIANPQFSTTYTVEVVDRNGCRNTGDIRVEIVCNGQNFFVPNTFSPNGDGSNDVFYLRGTGLFRVKALRVFNRWGELVFEKREFPVNNAASGWDGTYKGKKAQPDVYVYQLEIICNNGQTIQYAGNIALIR